ncbi:hypothetical protein [Natronorubrum daqingense]|uniref:Uncharacterized protein n=1 Tax=Natronorubrum daqingense TaxID=588898 RepID=A0A1N7FY97_9EURY|nr:hypothetical protein [Natronorubrum daqingense]APX98559.1 hypothetical protein BB347_17800 [Natronorubrum daqingense]SIS05291.1 hypothetical protein SAMN05421809_3567 [Natronorubrum daqingense]
MVRGGCKHCGQRTTNNRLCNRCQTLEHRDFFVETDGQPTNTDDALEYRCTNCGCEYTAAGSESCPDCGSRRRRYIGPLSGEQPNERTLATDGGRDTHQGTLEFVFEYTTVDDRRRRVTIIPDTGGEGWRITHERRDGEWRETGREPISGLHLQLSSTENANPATPSTNHSAVDLETLATAHDQLEWADVPNVSTAEAAAWAARLREAHDRLETDLTGTVDRPAEIDSDGGTTTVRGPKPDTQEPSPGGPNA